MEEVFNTDLEKKILALVKASFRVSDLISDLIFREKIKHQILDVYKKFFFKNNQDLLSELDILDRMFYLAGHLNLAKEEHVKSLRNGFLVFKSHIVLANHQQITDVNSEKIHKNTFSLLNNNSDETIADDERALKILQENVNEKLNERQLKILKYFENRKEIKFTELSKLFPDLSQKTIRNDLVYLIKVRKLNRLERGTYERR